MASGRKPCGSRATMIPSCDRNTSANAPSICSSASRNADGSVRSRDRATRWRTTSVSREAWKIAVFHHPLYSNAGRHGSSVDLRTVLEPVLQAHGVKVVFSGHDHIYERLIPQQGIHYFVVGSSGQLRRGDLRRSASTAAGNDQDQAFMLVEIDQNELFFETITRTGTTIDSGRILRQTTTSDQEARHED